MAVTHGYNLEIHLMGDSDIKTQLCSTETSAEDVGNAFINEKLNNGFHVIAGSTKEAVFIKDSEIDYIRITKDMSME